MIQDQSIFDLLIRFWEDYYEKHQSEARRGEDGEVVYETGDPLIDKWEKEIAMGLDPDLMEGLPTEEREAAHTEKKAFGALWAGEDLGFSDDYSQSR